MTTCIASDACPSCGHEMTSVTHVDGCLTAPAPGTVSICSACGDPAEWDQDGKLTPMMLYDLDRETMRKVVAVRAIIKARRHGDRPWHPEAFARTEPCLEEIEGYRDSVVAQGLTYSSEEWAPLFEWEQKVRSGKAVPAPSGLVRSWKYQRGRKPVRAR